MPEGPEIRLAADRIAAVLDGQTVEKVEFGLARLEPFAASLEGQRVERVETRGQAVSGSSLRPRARAGCICARCARAD